MGDETLHGKGMSGRIKILNVRHKSGGQGTFHRVSRWDRRP